MAQRLVIIHKPRNECAESNLTLSVLETTRLKLKPELIDITETTERPPELILADKKMSRKINNFPVMMLLDGEYMEDVKIEPKTEAQALDFLHANELVQEEE